MENNKDCQYLIYIFECPICGRDTEEYIEEICNRSIPDTPMGRFKYIQKDCTCFDHDYYK